MTLAAPEGITHPIGDWRAGTVWGLRHARPGRRQVTVAGGVLDAAVKATWIYSVVYQVMFHVGGLSGRRRSL